MPRHTPRYTTHRDFDDVPSGSVFVFGSNLAGRHGAGAARHAAERFGAQFGIGVGRTGQAYAIPTKGYRLEVLDIALIELHVSLFKRYAWEHMGERFFITRVGCGLAGFRDADIAPLFHGITDNVSIPVQWARYIDVPVPATAKAHMDYVCMPEC